MAMKFVAVLGNSGNMHGGEKNVPSGVFCFEKKKNKKRDDKYGRHERRLRRKCFSEQ